MTRAVDLNADLGEGSAEDAGLLDVVTSCNIACGGHAGDEESMWEALLGARARGVEAGAHPSFPDRPGFGRRRLTMSAEDLSASLTAQVSALAALADQACLRLSHVKPHGALYNEAARNLALARSVARAAGEGAPGAALTGPPGSALRAAAEEAGLRFLAEGFADRAYEADGGLRPRDQEGAVLSGGARAAQAVALATAAPIPGVALALRVETICLHADSEGAAVGARAVRAALEAAGVTVRAPRVRA